MLEEVFVAWLYAKNYRSDVPLPELCRRTWHWTKAFAANTNAYACFVLLSAVLLYSTFDIEAMDMGMNEAMAGGGGRGGRGRGLEETI